MEYLNNDLGPMVLILCAGLCQVQGLQASSPWHSAGVNTCVPSVPLQILQIPDLFNTENNNDWIDRL